MDQQNQPIRLDRSHLPSIIDRELSDPADDAFGHNHFAQALEDLIESQSMKPPFSIGLLGPWGTGKSSIKGLYLRSLGSDGTKRDGKKRSDRVKCITFNAWRYGGEEDLKRALLREAFLQLGGDEAELDRELLQQISETAAHRRQLKDWAAEVFGQFFANAFVFVLLCAALFGCIVGISHLVGWSETEGWTLPAIGVVSLLVTGWISKQLINLRMSVPALFEPRTTIAFPSRSAEEYEKLLLKQIRSFKTSTAKSVERLVVFVDDLDRLSSAEMVRGLDAIRNFLELPLSSISPELGVVFVISCDEDRVAEALHQKRYRSGSEDLPGTVFTKTDARRYLDRLFQFRLEIPLFPKQDMREFAKQKLESLPGVVEQLEQRNVPVDTTIDTLIHVGVQSPRNAVQLLNAFLQSWWLAVQRENDGRGSNRAGALDPGAVTDHPIMLAALTVLKVDFPDFYDCVQERPDFLDELSSVLFGNVDPNQAPPASKSLLERYLDTRDGQLTSSMKQHHSSLRQFLSNLDGMRRPKRLQPLLKLAVDPISRNFGDGAQDVFDALVSGDTQGVLENLNRSLDNNPFGSNETILLQGLAETAMQDTRQRRINSARVLAALQSRLPTTDRARLLRPVIQQLVSEKDLRQQIAPAQVHAIIGDAKERDQVDVAGAYIDDLLHGGDIIWRKPGGGTPNLTETTALVKSTIDLAISVLERHKLSVAHTQRLKAFLASRSITMSGKTTSLPYDFLDQIVRKNPSVLLPIISREYTDQTIESLKAETAPLAEPPETLNHIRAEFDRLAVAGQEDRAILWAFLNDLISVRNKDAVGLAWTSASQHKDLATAQQATTFLASFASRLEKDIEDQESWGVEWPEGGNRFADLLNNWRDFVDDTSAQSLVGIVAGWSELEGCEDLAERCLDILRVRSRSSWGQAINQILAVDFGTIPPKIAAYLGSTAEYLTEENAGMLKSRLDQVVNESEPDKNNVTVYRTVIKNLPESLWQNENWSAHLSHALTRFNQMHSQPIFIERILPALVPKLSYAKAGSPAAMMSQLFANSAGHPEAYAVVHGTFKGHWPPTNTQIGDYRPDEVAQRAIQFIRDNANNPKIGTVFASLMDMFSKSLLGDDVLRPISEIVPLVWRSAPRAVLENKSVVSEVIEPVAVSAFLIGPQPADVSREEFLDLLTSISTVYDPSLRTETLTAILGAQPVELFDQPDGGVHIWLSAIGGNANAVFSKLLSSEALNDEQRRRLIVQTPIQFWMKDGLAILGALISANGSPKSQREVISILSAIGKEAVTEEQKAEIAEVLIRSLPELSAEHVSSVGVQINALNGRRALEKSDTIAELDGTQLEALLVIFPASGTLKALLKSVQSDQPAGQE